VYIGHDILLVSPVAVIVRFSQLICEADFWNSVLFSFQRITSGFLLAILLGGMSAALSARFRRIEELLAPVVLVFKSTPVASFTILVLIWVSSRNLSVLISFLTVFPVVYTNLLNGIRNTDSKLLEMACVFDVPTHRRIVFIYLSQIMPFFRAACMVGLGLCWKAGVAAEVIGIPTGSIGEKLYMSKVYFNTPDLFAWTLTVIIISLLFEKLFMFLLDLIIRKIERL